MSTYLITGASRGIGFEFIRQISANPANVVVGLVRNKASTEKKVKELKRSNIRIIQADLTDYDSLKGSVEQVAAAVNRSLDYLIANAGYISAYSAYDTLSALGSSPQKLEEDLLTCFRVNTIGNVHLFNLFLPLVLKGRAKKVVCLGTGFADDYLTTKYNIDVAGPYTISKAAMNTVVAKYSAEYSQDGVLFLSLAPGAVETGQDAGIEMSEEQMKRAMDLGAKFAKYAPSFQGRISPEESVTKMLRVIDIASVEGGYGGNFISQNGNKYWL